MSMASYSAYGLGIHSELQLFQLPYQEVNQDISIRLGQIRVESKQDHLPIPFLKLNTQDVIFAVPSVAKYRVYAGREIIIDPEPGADNLLLQGYIVGAAMAILLNQRGRLVLHASAVNVFGKGVAFLGASGAGKSSIAAGLMMRGHSLLVDDLVSIDIKTDTAVIYPGFPQLKISKDLAESLDNRDTQLEYMDDLDEKQNYRLMNRFHQDSIEVKQIYVLELSEGDQLEIQELPLQQSVIELVRYSMPTSIAQYDKVANFNKCVKLAELTDIYRLVRPLSLELIAHAAAKIEKRAQ